MFLFWNGCGEKSYHHAKPHVGEQAARSGAKWAPLVSSQFHTSYCAIRRGTRAASCYSSESGWNRRRHTFVAFGLDPKAQRDGTPRELLWVLGSSPSTTI